MLKRLLAVSMLGLLLCAMSPAWGLSKQQVKKHNEMLYTVVLVEGPAGSGSGTVIFSDELTVDDEKEYHNYILTNHHVISMAITIKKEWDPNLGKERKKESRRPVEATWHIYNDYSHMIGSRSQKAEIVAYNDRLDLALLRLRDRERPIDGPVATLLPDGEKIYLYDEVWLSGAGLGEPPFSSFGHISNLDRIIEGEPYFLTTSPIIYGDSGGALFRYSAKRDKYELIGVPSKVRIVGWGTPVTHMAMSIPIDTVRDFLRENCYHEILDEPLGEDCSSIGEIEYDYEEDD